MSAHHQVASLQVTLTSDRSTTVPHALSGPGDVHIVKEAGGNSFLELSDGTRILMVDPKNQLSVVKENRRAAHARLYQTSIGKMLIITVDGMDKGFKGLLDHGDNVVMEAVRAALGAEARFGTR